MIGQRILITIEYFYIFCMITQNYTNVGLTIKFTCNLGAMFKLLRYVEAYHFSCCCQAGVKGLINFHFSKYIEHGKGIFIIGIIKIPPDRISYEVFSFFMHIDAWIELEIQEHDIVVM